MLIDRLLARPNVVFTPHIAFNCIESVERINAATVANIVRFISGMPIDIPADRVGCEPRVKPSDELCLAANNSVIRSPTNPQPINP